MYNGVSLSDEGTSSETPENLNEQGLDILLVNQSLIVQTSILMTFFPRTLLRNHWIRYSLTESSARCTQMLKSMRTLRELLSEDSVDLLSSRMTWGKSCHGTFLILKNRLVSCFNCSFRSRVGLQVVLSTSLVHLTPPKHHAQAMTLIKEIVAVSPDNVAALMSRGNILLASKEWSAARESFDRVISVDTHSFYALRAREESAWCESRLGEYESAVGHFEEVLRELEAEERDGFDIARCLWRLGQTQWDSGGTPCLPWTFEVLTCVDPPCVVRPRSCIPALHSSSEKGFIVRTGLHISWSVLLGVRIPC